LWEQFVSGVLQESSIILWRWNAQIDRTVASFINLASGWDIMPGMKQPVTEVCAEGVWIGHCLKWISALVLAASQGGFWCLRARCLALCVSR
jgi:hypothetical protein